MVERICLDVYIVFFMLNIFIFCIFVYWVWVFGGWLYEMGVIDIVGVGLVYFVGGVIGLVVILMLKLRYGWFIMDKNE